MLELNSGIVWTVINLIILVVLMRIFLFKPIQKVIDERKKMISEQIDSAKDREESAAKKLEEAEAYLQASGDNARKQAEAILKEAEMKNQKLIAQANPRRTAFLRIPGSRRKRKETRCLRNPEKKLQVLLCRRRKSWPAFM